MNNSAEGLKIVYIVGRYIGPHDVQRLCLKRYNVVIYVIRLKSHA